MEGTVTLLIFSRNDVDNAIGLIRGLGSAVDQVIVIDSSKSSEFAKLKKEEKKMPGMRAYHTVALGVADVFRMYGLGKCNSDWVLYLDTDERISTRLKDDLRDIISGGGDAFAIKRYEDVRKGRKTNFFTWQTRLFKRGKVKFSGMLHEQADVFGNTARLGDLYYIEHRHELMHHERNEYFKLNRFERLSYADYNAKMLEYVSKMTVPEGGMPEKTLVGKAMLALLLMYEKATMRNMDSELSSHDYFIFYLLRNLAFNIKADGFMGIYGGVRGTLIQARKMREWRAEPDSREIFEIAQIINKIGIIRFLDLDKESTIRRLNKRYLGSRNQGIALLINLIREKHGKKNRSHVR
jgi:hypothetical protein